MKKPILCEYQSALKRVEGLRSRFKNDYTLPEDVANDRMQLCDVIISALSVAMMATDAKEKAEQAERIRLRKMEESE